LPEPIVIDARVAKRRSRVANKFEYDIASITYINWLKLSYIVSFIYDSPLLVAYVHRKNQPLGQNIFGEIKDHAAKYVYLKKKKKWLEFCWILDKIQ
jgi:hypothetical protein